MNKSYPMGQGDPRGRGEVSCPWVRILPELRLSGEITSVGWDLVPPLVGARGWVNRGIAAHEVGIKMWGEPELLPKIWV
ncbi:hypothetical protein PROH_03580 [Prochlorothrix hollandica PCC 9006 = CALU 1027]|uniref:Uncharacterized protein n=1 Tax=Prochlorothrix hollandica PCC 9006 = CALU 1027 TaxID=317619 RepID=A0A0M2Q2E1_PROHO|nr:hypothetical protein PROH_03580 [Prochlorothrix hollandica PCC 9006 = CALU 1027]